MLKLFKFTTVVAVLLLFSCSEPINSVQADPIEKNEQSSVVLTPTYQITQNNVQFDSVINVNQADQFQYVWDFGDSNSSQLKNPTHQYQQTGIYFVSLTITDGSQTISEQFQIQITSLENVNSPPVARYTYNVNDLQLQLDASISSDPNMDPLTYYWVINDQQQLMGEQVTVDFANYGSHVVTLYVTDSQGLQSNDSQIITLTAPIVTTPINANFNVLNQDLEIYLDASLTQNSAQGTLTYHWSVYPLFSNEIDPIQIQTQSQTSNITLSEYGQYVIELKVVDEQLNESLLSKNIEIVDPFIPNVVPTISINNSDNTQFDASSELTFSASQTISNIDISEYIWQINGETFDTMDVQYTFTQTGQYSIELTIIASDQTQWTSTKLININPLIVPQSDLIISEVVASSKTDFFLEGNDWIELYNAGSQDVLLSQYAIADQNMLPAELPSVVLTSGEYYVIQANDLAPDNGLDYLPFKIGKEDSVYLFLNNQIVDSVSWLDGENKSGRAYGRIGEEFLTLYPTPGYDNVKYKLFTKEEVFTVKVQMDSEEFDLLMQGEEVWRPATLNFNGAIVENIAIRPKGQSSLSMIKGKTHRYGFKIDFNRYQEGQEFMGRDMIVLGNSFADPTLMRDIIAYQAFRDAGMPAPKASFVDLWVGGEHLGVYQLIEAIDDEFAKKYFDDDDENNNIGDLYKAELNQNLTYESTVPEGLELKTNKESLETNEAHSALLNFLDSLNNSNDPMQNVDTDLMVKYIATSVLISNMDSYFSSTANNFYLYEHRSVNKFTMLPWDYNLAFGTVEDGGWFASGCGVINHVIEQPIDSANERPMVTKVLEQPELMLAYKQKLQELLDTTYHPDYLQAEIFRLRDLIDPYVQNDPTMFFTYEEWRSSLEVDMPENSSIQDGRGGGFFGPAPGLIPFIQKRTENIQKQLNGEITAKGQEGNACPEDWVNPNPGGGFNFGF